MPINGRQKGHAYERKIRREMIDLGWEDCQTSRFESKMLDDAGVDLTRTDPISIQAKHVEKNLNYHKILSSMPDNGNYNVIFHKRNRQGEVVSMMKEDFYELIEMLKKNKIL